MLKYSEVSLRASFALLKGDTFSDGVDHICAKARVWYSPAVQPRIIPRIEGQGREAAGLIVLIMLINCKSEITHLQLCCCYCYVRL